MSPLFVLSLLGTGGYLLYKKLKSPRTRVKGKSGTTWDTEIYKREKGLAYVHIYFPVPSAKLEDSPLIASYYQKAGDNKQVRYYLGSPKKLLNTSYHGLIKTAISDFALKTLPKKK